MNRLSIAFISLVFATAPALASAADAGSAEAAPAASGSAGQRDIAVTISPLHLLSPILELTTEFRVDDRVGVAAIGGFGRVDREFWAFLAGGQMRWYALGSFAHGLQLGGQLLYLHVNSSDIDGSGIGGAGNGLALGPFLGYKFTSSVGLTVEVQGGVQVLAIDTAADDGSTARGGSFGPLANANIGWSF